MKWFIFLLLIGVTEVFLIGTIHDHLGTQNSIIIYLITTIIGFTIAWIVKPKFEGHLHNARLGKNFKKRVKEERLTLQDQQKIFSMTHYLLYLLGCVFIAIPGLITDIIGILIIIPTITKMIAAPLSEAIMLIYKKQNA